MIEQRDNIWNYRYVCITTNGFVKRDGSCVMGRGVAKQCVQRYPKIPRLLGSYINKYGNKVFYLGRQYDDIHLFSFPVKPSYVIYDDSNVIDYMKNKFKVGEKVPGWAAKADINIIKQSAIQLKDLVNKFNLEYIVIPRPGCGAGELKWEIVKEVLEPIFDDERFIIVYL